MTDPKESVIRLTGANTERACEMLSRAFFHDLKMTHLIPEIAARKDLSKHLFEFELRYGMIYGDVYTTSPVVEGVAVWLPSDRSEITLWRAFRAGGMGLQRHLGKETMDRLMAFSTTIDDLDKKHVHSPHCYLLCMMTPPPGGSIPRPESDSRLDHLNNKKISLSRRASERP